MRSAHLVQARRPIGLAEQFPCFRQAHGSEVTVEPTTDNPVVRIVGFEEERLADGEGMESTTATRTPEIDLQEVGTGRQEVIPVVVGHSDVTPHTGIMHSVRLGWVRTRCRRARQVKQQSSRPRSRYTYPSSHDQPVLVLTTEDRASPMLQCQAEADWPRRRRVGQAVRLELSQPTATLMRREGRSWRQTGRASTGSSWSEAHSCPWRRTRQTAESEDDFLDLARKIRQRDPAASLAADLFSGGGGLSLGLQQAGFHVILAADHYPEAVETHRHHFPGLSVDWDLPTRRRSRGSPHLSPALGSIS